MADAGKFRLEIQGLRELRKAIRDLPKDVRKDMMSKATRPLAEELYRRSVPLVPVKTGKLRDTLTPTFAASFAGVQVRGLRYANFVHWGAIGWPKARGREAKSANRRLRRAKQRQLARGGSSGNNVIAGKLFIWRPAKDMARGRDSEAHRILEHYVNGLLNNIENEVNRARPIAPTGE